MEGSPSSPVRPLKRHGSMSSVVRRVFGGGRGRDEESPPGAPSSPPPLETFNKEMVGRPSHHQPITPSYAGLLGVCTFLFFICCFADPFPFVGLLHPDGEKDPKSNNVAAWENSQFEAG